jgi:hypothetical protein
MFGGLKSYREVLRVLKLNIFYFIYLSKIKE